MAKTMPEIVRCAHCGAESQQQVIASCSYNDIDLDTRPTGTARALIDYGIQECPVCHYAHPRLDRAEAPDQFPEGYDQLATDSTIQSTVKKYIMAAWLREISLDYKQAGELYLHAAWAYDDIDNDAGATSARNAAAKNIRAYVDNSKDGEAAIMLIDILRRAGRFKEASAMIEQLGETEDPFFNSILAFEKRLIEWKDTACHNMSEVSDGAV